MNVEEVIKATKPMMLSTRSMIHIQLVNNRINDRLTEALKPYGVSLQQFNVLRILKGRKGEAANLSTINNRMVTKMSNTTRLVDKLLLKGFVSRKRCVDNRRKIEIYITAEGEEELLKMSQAVSQAEMELGKNFSENDFHQLNELLNKF